uniref:Amino acid transporter transmembrane domain-containing protein n=1 Tax=Meloidogyne javanica TaxID=6303 RepID=A0A915N1F6_MELJA
MPVIQYPENIQTFSTTVGLLYIFNLIVGTGALTLPRAFQSAGYLLSLILLLICKFTSATFVIEALAIANYLSNKPLNRQTSSDEESPILFEENNENNYLDNNLREEENEERNGQKYILNKRFELHEQTEHVNLWDSLIDYFLALFPVFVLTSSYIIVAITLCNNMKVLFKLLINGKFGRIFIRRNLDNQEEEGIITNNNIEDNEPLLGGNENEEEQINFHSSTSTNLLLNNLNSPPQITIKLFLRKYGIPLIIFLIPSLISMATDNVLLLASITGTLYI